MTKHARPFLYLDHAASTPLRPGVLEAMRPFLSEVWGNPSSAHRQGRAARKGLEDARDAVAACLNALPREIVFTSGGTESDNIALFGAIGALPEDRNGVVTCATEHPAVLAPCRKLRAKVLAPLPDGRLDTAVFESALEPSTGLASVMMANNETGILHPIREIGETCRKRGVLLHTDAVQAVGHASLDWKTLPVDLLSLTAHKFGGPRGAGALIVRQGLKMKPLILGGDHEGGRRPGTENVAGAVGLAEALRQAVDGMAEETGRLQALRKRLVSALREAFPDLILHGHPTERLPQTANVSIPGVEGSTLLIALDQEGVSVSSGAACHTGSADPSPVLTAMGAPKEAARSAIRISLGHSSTAGEGDQALEILVRGAGRLRAKASSR